MKVDNTTNQKINNTEGGNQKWTIQRNWQQGTQDEGENTTQYVPDTTTSKQDFFMRKS